MAENTLRRLVKRVPGAQQIADLIQQPARDRLLRALPRKAVCAEIGVDTGKFSRRILKVTEPKELHLIDPWHYEVDERYNTARFGGMAKGGQAQLDERYEQVCQALAPHVMTGQVHIHRMPSDAAAEQFEDGYFDWVYIDGNHLYDWVRHDLRIYLRKLKPGGCLAGDDYGNPGWWDDGVTRAVDELLEEHPEFTFERFGHQFLIRC